MQTSSSKPRIHRPRSTTSLLLAVLAILLTAFTDRPVRAAEESSWAFLGFSPDGAYAAVEVFGFHQENDVPYSMIRIIDCKANQFVGPPLTTCIGQGCEDPKNPNPTLKEARTRNRQKVRDALAQYRIDATLQGERVPLWGKQRTVEQVDGASGMARETAPLKWLDADWALTLQEVPAPGGASGGAGQPRMIDLRLQRNGSELVLQKDRAIPKSRGAGIYYYELDAVVASRNALLVVLRHVRPGHQGPDTTQMFVTAAAF